MKNKIITLIIVVVVGAGSFYGGMRYAQSKGATNSLASQSNALGQGRQRIPGGNGGGNFSNANSGDFVSGQIIAKDDKSITIKLRDGGSKIVLYSASTQVSKMAAGTAEDLTVGAQVTASGQANSDGSVSAQTIQLRPNLP